MSDLKPVALLATSMYVGEPCRICGRNLTAKDMAEAVFAGYSACDRSRAAHGHCWCSATPKEQWAFPVDAARPRDFERIAALSAAVEQSPNDTDCRRILADALEEAGLPGLAAQARQHADYLDAVRFIQRVAASPSEP